MSSRTSKRVLAADMQPALAARLRPVPQTYQIRVATSGQPAFLAIDFLERKLIRQNDEILPSIVEGADALMGRLDALD
jgi:hypothetical protein